MSMFADPVHVSGRILAPGCQDMLIGGFRVVCLAVPLDDFQGTRGADIQAGAHAVAKKLADENGLVLFVQLKRPFGAGGRAQSAAVAEVAFDFDDFSFGHGIRLRGWIVHEEILQDGTGAVFDRSQIVSPPYRDAGRDNRGPGWSCLRP